MDNRKYIVDEKTLLNLLAAVSELEFLETSGVDNWIGYGEGRGEFIAKELETLTKQTVPIDKIYEESLDFMNVAEEKIKAFEIYDVPIAKAYEDDLKYEVNMCFQSATTIFATKERQEILSSAGINYAVDIDLYFVFENAQDRIKAYKILEDACEL